MSTEDELGSNIGGIGGFEIENEPNDDLNSSLNSHLLQHKQSPLITSTGNYFDEADSLTSSQIIKPMDINMDIKKHMGKKEASIFSSMMNLSNTILGAGLLGLPFAISKTGFILSFILFIIMGILSFIGLNLSCSAAKIKDRNASYYTLADLSVPRAKKIVDFAVAVKCFGVGTSYFVVIGDLMPAVMQEFLPSNLKCGVLSDRHLWIFIFSLLFIFPIVRLNKMDALRFTSIIAVLCFGYVTLIVVLFAFNVLNSGINNDDGGKGKLSAFPESGEIMDFLRVIPIYIFAFTCHQNSFTITNELKKNTLNRLNIVILNSLLLCIIIYCIVGYSGYFSYGSLVCGDILESYPNIIAVAIVRILLAIALAWSYPLQLHPCRKCLTSLMFDTIPDKLDKKKFYILTYSITLSSFAISMVVENLSVVLEFVGSIGSPIISFILPGLFYYKMTDPKIRLQPRYEIKRKIAFFYVIFGTIIIPFTFSMQIFGLIKGGNNDNQSLCSNGYCK